MSIDIGAISETMLVMFDNEGFGVEEPDSTAQGFMVPSMPSRMALLQGLHSRAALLSP